MEFGFVAIFKETNEVGIGVHISVGYKGKIGAAPMRCSPGLQLFEDNPVAGLVGTFPLNEAFFFQTLDCPLNCGS